MSRVPFKKKVLVRIFQLDSLFLFLVVIVYGMFGEEWAKAWWFQKGKTQKCANISSFNFCFVYSDTKRRRTEREERETESNVFDMVLGEKCD